MAQLLFVRSSMVMLFSLMPFPYKDSIFFGKWPMELQSVHNSLMASIIS